MPTYGKNDFKESNVNYLNKDFASLKQSLMDYAKSYFPNTYKDFNEASPGMMLLEMNAYVGDVLSFYVDQQYREMLLPLAEERRNIINLANMFGYKVKPIVPSYVDLTFTQNLNSDTSDRSKVDYSTGGIFNSGIQIKGTTNEIIFETLEVLDFQITESSDTNTVNTFDDNTGLAQTYNCKRTIRAISGKEKTSTFSIGAPEKFKKITLSDKNIIDIISCVDSNGNNWYEVDFLAQDKIPIETHYTNDANRSSAYHNALDGTTSEVAVPYSLSYNKTSKRFTRETNVDNTTSLVFGNGILRNGQLVDEGFIDLEQIGVVVPGQQGDLSSAINPLLGDEYSTLGETPNNTTLTITYRVGGGINSNLPSSDLTIIQNGTTMNGSANGVDIKDLTVTNNVPARGGKDEETIDEIREKTKAFFSTQNRCVTKEDYEARVLNIPGRFGNIAKVYVTRNVEGDESYADSDGSAINTALSEFGDYRESVQIRVERVRNNFLDGTLNEGTINALKNTIDGAAGDDLNGLQGRIDNIGGLIPSAIGETFNLSSIDIYVLAYNNLNELVGNPYEQGVSIPETLSENIKNYLTNFRILTDTVRIINGYIVNFGVFFDVIAEKYADKNKVKVRCMDKIKEYFEIQKMQFNQPIYKSQLEYELMGVEGVRSLNHLTITQEQDYFYEEPTVDATLSLPTYLYSYDEEIQNNDGTYGDYTTEGGTPDYGYYYDFQNALVDGIIRPPEPSTPAVFELKNPNQNIQGRVR